MADIKAYKPENNSISSGQVLQTAYSFEKARLVVREMADALSLDLVSKGLVADQLVLTIGYDIENLTDHKRQKAYKGEYSTDFYGRKVPKHAHGSINLSRQTSSTVLITNAAMELFDRIVDPALLVRRMYVVANHVVSEDMAAKAPQAEQLDLFTDYKALEQQRKAEQEQLEKEKRRQGAVLEIQQKFGKNAVFKGSSLADGATARERNEQIGGHKA